ncbi:MAG: class I SAM-dependent methyltransferase [Planctomycetaceae bacterium]|nr:class I SAM-dependent methyltransferase [Planctomycetaceae bacterium]
MTAVKEALEQAVCLHLKGDLQPAAQIYQSILAAQPNNADALQLSGVMAHQQGQFQTAIDLLKRAAEINPEPRTLHNLAAALRTIGRFDEALEYLPAARTETADSRVPFHFEGRFSSPLVDAGHRPGPSQRYNLLQDIARGELLNFLICEKGYRSYLEIGCDRDQTFSLIQAPHRVGVDPVSGGTLRMTSDDFFHCCREKFDLIFIDGEHEQRQVLTDVEHALTCLAPGGAIVLHDCLPAEEIQQVQPRQVSVWTGDVWKAAVQLRKRTDIDLTVLDSDFGLGVLFAQPPRSPLPADTPIAELLAWTDFCCDRERLLQVVDLAGMVDFIRRSGRTQAA